jgi:hypothetical protein
MLKNTAVPARKTNGVCIQNRALYTTVSHPTLPVNRLQLTHPVTGNSVPATTAPNATPEVYPALTSPTNKPLLFFPVSSSTKIIEMVKIPAAPIPLTARPTKKAASEGAWDVTSKPIEKITDETKIQFRAEKICVKRPARGAMLDTAIYFSLVPRFLDQDTMRRVMGIQSTQTRTSWLRRRRLGQQR